MDEVVIAFVLKYYPELEDGYTNQGFDWLAKAWFRRLWHNAIYTTGLTGIFEQIETAYLEVVDKKQYVACHQALFTAVHQMRDSNLFGDKPKEGVALRMWLQERIEGKIILDWFFYWLQMQQLGPIERFLWRCSRVILYPNGEGRIASIHFNFKLWQQIFDDAWTVFHENLRESTGDRVLFEQLKTLLHEVDIDAPNEWRNRIREADRYSGIKPSSATQPRRSVGLSQYDLVPLEKRYLCGIPKEGPEDLVKRWKVLKPCWVHKEGLVDEKGKRRIGLSSFDPSFFRDVMDSFWWREFYTCWALALLSKKLGIKDEEVPPVPIHLRMDVFASALLLSDASADEINRMVHTSPELGEHLARIIKQEQDAANVSSIAPDNAASSKKGDDKDISRDKAPASEQAQMDVIGNATLKKVPTPKLEFDLWNGLLIDYTVEELQALMIKVGLLDENNQPTSESKPRKWMGAIAGLRKARRLVYNDNAALYRALCSLTKPSKVIKPRTLTEGYNDKNTDSRSIYTRVIAFLGV